MQDLYFGEEHIIEEYEILKKQAYIKGYISDNPEKALFQESYALKINENNFKQFNNYKKIGILDTVVSFERGYGKKIINDFFKFLNNKKVEKVFLFANTSLKQEEGFNLLSFYESLGLRQVSKHKEFVLMEKDILKPKQKNKNRLK